MSIIAAHGAAGASRPPRVHAVVRCVRGRRQLNRIGGDPDGQMRRRYCVPAEGMSEIGDRQLPGPGEVVGASLAVANDRSGKRGGDVVVVDELERHARVGQDRSQLGHLAQRPSQRSRDPLAEGQERDHVEQKSGLRSGDDAGAKNIGVGV